MATVRWAVVGTSPFALDWIARGISLARNATLAAVVGRDPARTAAAAERIGAPHVYSAIEQIDRSAVDGVFIVAPNDVHASLAITAAQRGLHVLVEKPMAPSLAACQSMIDTAREHGVLLAVAHCMEWAPPVAAAARLIGEGAVGTPISATITASFDSPPTHEWRQQAPAEVGGGPLLDMGIHAIDTLQRLLGPIAQVSAFLDRRIYDYPAEDSASVLLRFASGAHGLMQSHFNCAQNQLEVQGSAGRIWSNAWLGRDFSGDLFLQQGQQVTPIELPRVNVYVPQIEHVSDCVLSGAAPLISGERGLANMAVVHAAIQSARSGAVVQV